MAEPFTALRISDTHEWRFVDRRGWSLHFLPHDDGMPLRHASRFEAELLNAARREVETARGVAVDGEQTFSQQSPMGSDT